MRYTRYTIDRFTATFRIYDELTTNNENDNY